MKAQQPTARFSLAVLAINKCTLMLTASITATLAQFDNSVNDSPFKDYQVLSSPFKQFSVRMLLFPKIIGAFGVSLDGFSIDIRHDMNGVLKDRPVTE